MVYDNEKKIDIKKIHENAVLYQQLLNKRYILLASNKENKNIKTEIPIEVRFENVNFMHFCGFSNDIDKNNYISIKPFDFYNKAINNSLTINDLKGFSFHNKDTIKTVKEKINNFTTLVNPYIKELQDRRSYLCVGIPTTTRDYPYGIWVYGNGIDNKNRTKGCDLMLTNGNINVSNKDIPADYSIPVSNRSDTLDWLLDKGVRLLSLDYVFSMDYSYNDRDKVYTDITYGDKDPEKLYDYLDKLHLDIRVDIDGMKPGKVIYKETIDKDKTLTPTEKAFFKSLVSKPERLDYSIANFIYKDYVNSSDRKAQSELSTGVYGAIKNEYIASQPYSENVRDHLTMMESDAIEKMIRNTLLSGIDMEDIKVYEYNIGLDKNNILHTFIDVDMGKVAYKDSSLHLCIRIDKGTGDNSILLIDKSAHNSGYKTTDIRYRYPNLDNAIISSLGIDDFDDLKIAAMDYEDNEGLRIYSSPDELYQSKDNMDKMKVSDRTEGFIRYLKENVMDKDFLHHA